MQARAKFQKGYTKYVNNTIVWIIVYYNFVGFVVVVVAVVVPDSMQFIRDIRIFHLMQR